MKISALNTGGLLYPNLKHLSWGTSLYFAPLDVGTAYVQMPELFAYVTHADQLGHASDHA